MAKLGIFFGSDTGNTEKIAHKIQDILGHETADIFDIAKSTQSDIESYSFLLFGIPTWYYGESQCDWDDFMPTLGKINFNGKKIGIFGCGDQEDYGDYFCDAMGTIKDIILPLGANIVGLWPTAGYQFESSKAVVDANHFIGLVIDEDRQPEMTEERVRIWAEKIKQEMGL